MLRPQRRQRDVVSLQPLPIGELRSDRAAVEERRARKPFARPDQHQPAAGDPAAETLRLGKDRREAVAARDVSGDRTRNQRREQHRRPEQETAAAAAELQRRGAPAEAPAEPDAPRQRRRRDQRRRSRKRQQIDLTLAARDRKHREGDRDQREQQDATRGTAAEKSAAPKPESGEQQRQVGVKLFRQMPEIIPARSAVIPVGSGKTPEVVVKQHGFDRLRAVGFVKAPEVEREGGETARRHRLQCRG